MAIKIDLVTSGIELEAGGISLAQVPVITDGELNGRVTAERLIGHQRFADIQRMSNHINANDVFEGIATDKALQQAYVAKVNAEKLFEQCYYKHYYKACDEANSRQSSRVYG